MNPIIWLVLFIVMLVAELMTMGLTTIWFAGGALAAFFAALLDSHLMVQVVLFVVVSIVLLLFTRPLAAKYLNRNTVKTNVESLEGRIAYVTEEIDNMEARGTVTIDGIVWSARAAVESDKIAVGERIRILGVRGVKLIVERCKEE